MSVPQILLSRLDGATVPATFVLRDDTPGITEAKFFLVNADRAYLSSAKAAPFTAAVSVEPGPNTIEVRHDVDGDRATVTASFTARSTTTPSLPASTPTGAVRVPAVPVPTPTVGVSTAAQLAVELARARPGAVIHLADGVYRNARGRRWHLSRSGTPGQPITLAGGRGAVLETDSPNGDYGLWITGSYWHVLGLTVANASKGIVLDHSQHTVIDDVDVHRIGDEGVHFRTCSSDDTLQNSSVHDTGLGSPNFGEGVYVGSANSNWSKYGCSAGQDRSERAVIAGNTFRHIAAEGADLKEGTNSGTLAGNLFVDAGYSGENSADSAVDVKGNNWTVSANVVTEPGGADRDAFQTHTVYPGYGTLNVFGGNVVRGRWPGVGFGLYPAAANIVFCTNTAPDAAGGLVGDGGRAARCAR